MEVLITIAALTLLAIIRERSFILERKEWTQERHMLLDRIQAKDLPEYKALEDHPKPPVPTQPTDDIVEI